LLVQGSTGGYLFIPPLRSPNELITPNEVVSLDRGLLV